MKKIYTTIVIVLFISVTYNKCMAQWTTVYHDNNPNAKFYDAAFPTDFTGYVAATDSVGAVVLRTNNGGVTWNKRYIAGWSFIDKIVMYDSISGYLIKGGVPGKILKTNDGFTTYTVHNIDSSFTVQAIALVNDSTGFYLNNAAKLRKFQHNGYSHSHIIDTLVDGQNLQFVNSHTGYLDTGNGLLMTSDAGNSWNYANNNLGFFCVVFNFADSLNAYFSDGSIIYKTSDGGITFPQQYNFPNTYGFAVNGNFCMAPNDTGNVAYTSDGGVTWQTETTGINFISAEPYKVINTPGGYCFLFSADAGEIRKRTQRIIAGISSPSIDYNISIYPNPFSSETTVSFGEQQKNTSIRITDILGKEIKTINFTGKQCAINKGEMNSGIYYVQIIDEKKNIINKKIIIQ